jgi:hypothetical protein
MVAEPVKGERFSMYKKTVALALVMVPGYMLCNDAVSKALCCDIVDKVIDKAKHAGQAIQQKCKDDCDGTTARRAAEEAAHRAALAKMQAEERERQQRAERERDIEHANNQRMNQRREEELRRREQETQHQWNHAHSGVPCACQPRNNNYNDPYKRGGR